MQNFLLPPDFEEVPHKADAALNLTGRDLAGLFLHAARGMYHIMGIKVGDSSGKRVTISLQETDYESLLVSFLNELLYFAEKKVFLKVMKIQISPYFLKGELLEYPLLNYEREIKAVTFNEMQIIENKLGYYQTRIVFDI